MSRPSMSRPSMSPMSRPSMSRPPMSPFAALATALVSSLILVACGTAGTPPGDLIPTPGPASIVDRLEAAPLAFELSPDTSAVAVEVTTSTASDEPPQGLEVSGGSAMLARDVDGTTWLAALDVSFEELTWTDEVLPEGLHLTDITTHLVEPVALEGRWDEAGNELLAAAPVVLELRWSVVADDGTVAALAPQELPRAELAAHVRVDADGVTRIDIVGGIEGPFWQWADLFEMSDAGFVLNGSEIALPLD